MKKIFPHITIILALMTLTFFVIHQFNEMMGFMTSEMSQWVFAALAVFALVSSVRLIVCDWNEDRRARERQARMERQARRRRQAGEAMELRPGEAQEQPADASSEE